MGLVLGVVKFKGTNRAFEVLDGYVEVHPGEGWPDQVAIISRHKLGRISVYESSGYDWDDDTTSGLGVGGLTGMLVGALAGPVGMAVGGVLGGSIGALTGAAVEADEPLYAVIRAKLEKDSSAALLLADDRIVDRMLQEFGPQGVDKLRFNVSDELYGNLEAAVRAAAEGRAQPAPAP